MVALAIPAFLGGCGGDDVSCDLSAADYRTWRTSSLDATGDRETARQQVADRLIACDSLDGLRQADVRNRLGKPPLTEPTTWTFPLGPDRRRGGARFETEYLNVTFASGRVVRVAITVP